MKIYTKSGDKGETSLYNGSRVSKTNPTLEALGDVDELNSAVGLSREYSFLQDNESPLLEQLEFIQSRLLDVGSAVATPISSSSKQAIERVRFDPEATTAIENWIDKMNDTLPHLTLFILPSGGLASGHLHMARSICRRAERSVIPLSDGGELDSSVAIFLNRLSDYFFVAARYMAMACGKPEQTYKKSKG